MNSSTSVYLVPTSTALSSAGITQNPDPPERAVWIFVLVEMLYIVIFIVIMVIIHFTGYMMSDDDAVTVHHKIHGQLIESQEKNFVEEQQKNLANAGP